jgi:integrase
MKKAIKRKFNFTVNAIKALPIPEPGGRATYRDSGTRGLGLQVLDSGVKTFFWQRKTRGRRTWRTLGNFLDLSIEQARDRAAEHNAKRTDWKARGFKDADPFKRTDGLTLGKVLDDYVDGYLKANAKNPTRACKGVRWQFKRYCESLRGRTLSSITHEDVEKLHRTVGQKYGHFTANRMLQLLRALYNHAKYEPNPARGVDLFEEKSRDRFLQPDELARLFTALSTKKGSDICDFVLLSLFSGARSGDVLSMRWENVVLATSTWHVPDPKSGHAYDVPLVPEAVEILEARNKNTPWVFPGHRRGRHLTNLKRPWKKLLAEAKLNNLRVHDLRRTHGSWLAGAGVSLLTISKSLGHASTAMTERAYAHINISTVRDAVTLATRAMLTAGEK